MDLTEYAESVHSQFVAAAEAGGVEAAALAERLFAPLESAVRLVIQDALSRAAEEITTEMAPGSVELRLRGRELEFVVSRPRAEHDDDRKPRDEGLPAPQLADGDEGGTARINLRIPEQLKERVDAAARREGLSANTWLVRAVAAVLDRAEQPRQHEVRTPKASQHLTGWSR